MAIIEGVEKIGSGLYLGEPKVARANYDFAVDGGAVGSITLRGDTLPVGAIITDSLLSVDTALTSGGAATVSINTESAADINSAAAVSGAPWSTTGAKRGGLTATTAPVKTTATRSIVATIATAALTAGKFSVVLTYVDLA